MIGRPIGAFASAALAPDPENTKAAALFAGMPRASAAAALFAGMPRASAAAALFAEMPRASAVLLPRPASALVALMVAAAALAGCGDDGSSAPTPTVSSIAGVAGDAQTGTAGAVLAVDPVVEVRDASGAPMAGVSVRFVASGGGALSDTMVVTGANGRASSAWILGPDAAAANSLRASAGAVAVDIGAEATVPQPGVTYMGRNGYIEYIAGDLPIIITAPHGGTMQPQEIPDRTGTGITTVRDANTEELARTIGNVFANRVGGRPHIIIVRLQRTKIDANREFVEATQANRLAGRAWAEYHAFVEAAKHAVLAQHGRGFYIDLHGHGHAIQRLELGYLLSSATLGLADATLDAPAYETLTAIRELSQASPASFAEILRGPTSLGALFEAEGFPSVPSPSSPDPGGDPYFTGGYNTERHGSRNGGQISGVQIEANFTGVRDNQANRELFATALVSVLDDYLATHAGMGLSQAVASSGFAPWALGSYP